MRVFDKLNSIKNVQLSTLVKQKTSKREKKINFMSNNGFKVDFMKSQQLKHFPALIDGSWHATIMRNIKRRTFQTFSVLFAEKINARYKWRRIKK